MSSRPSAIRAWFGRFHGGRLECWLALAAAGGLLVYFAIRSWPTPAPVSLLGPAPDTPDYVGGAVALLRGEYVVDWDGTRRTPIYPPGYSLLLTPAVALGGPEASAWTPYLAGVALGLLGAFAAVRLSNVLAAPVAVFFVLFSTAPRMLAQLVLSDLVSAALVVLQATLLTFGRRSGVLLLAGVLGGLMVWVRLSAAPLLVAGLVTLTARPRWRSDWIWFLAGVLPILVLLGFWQWSTFGSPFVTGYQTVGAGPGGDGSLTALFSGQYVLGAPAGADGPVHGGAARLWELPNLAFYPIELLGVDSFLLRPGVGLVGLVALIVFSQAHAPRGVWGRYGLVSLSVTLAVYVPYFYQSGRFLTAPAALLGIAAAAGIVRCLGTLVQH